MWATQVSLLRVWMVLMWPVQNVAWCHQKKHIDYSQLLHLVADWCEVREDRGPLLFESTESIYRSADLGNLAHGAAGIPPNAHYSPIP